MRGNPHHFQFRTYSDSVKKCVVYCSVTERIADYDAGWLLLICECRTKLPPVGTVIQSTVTITPINGFSGNPNIGWTGSGVSVCDIRLPPMVANNTALITCGGEIAFWSPAPGYYSLTVTGTFGSLFHSTDLSFSFVAPPCTNGATNYPQCTSFTTVSSMTCSPTTITAKVTGSSCITTVSSAHSPASGTITFTFSQTWGVGNICTVASPSTSCNCTLNSGSCAISVTDFGSCASSFTVYAQYDGDTNHQVSSTQFTLSVQCPPSTVTVSGTAGVFGVGRAYQIQFVSGGLTYTAMVNGAGAGASGT